MEQRILKLNVGEKVVAIITKNGYVVGRYKGEVVGYTEQGRVKVKSWRGVKCHAVDNVRTYG